jgi:hypothetical protein
MAPLAGGTSEAILLATGAASGATVEAIAELARSTIARLTIPGRSPGAERPTVVAVAGALDARDAADLLATPRDVTVVVADPTRIVLRGKLLDRFLAAFDVRCERPLRIVACTTASCGPGRSVDPRRLVRAVAAATGLPTFDVVAGLRA